MPLNPASEIGGLEGTPPPAGSLAAVSGPGPGLLGGSPYAQVKETELLPSACTRGNASLANKAGSNCPQEPLAQADTKKEEGQGLNANALPGSPGAALVLGVPFPGGEAGYSNRRDLLSHGGCMKVEKRPVLYTNTEAQGLKETRLFQSAVGSQRQSDLQTQRQPLPVLVGTTMLTGASAGGTQKPDGS